jgi:hypothetical protein
METVYLGTDGLNEIVLSEEDENGNQIPATDYFPYINKIVLKWAGETFVDSSLSPEAIDYVSKANQGIVLLKLGQLGLDAGIYKGVSLVTYDTINDDGIVWAHDLVFQVIDDDGVALAFDGTEKGENANTYASIGDADSFFNTQYGMDEWFSISATDKARLLITATRMIDEMPLTYSKATEEQALQFPLGDPDGNEVGFTEANKACMWQAWWIYNTNESIKEANSYKAMGIRTEQVGPLKSVKVGYNPFAKFSPEALALISEYTDFNFVIRRG